jgi:Skp family chaperone for outer membrane proteins
MGAVFVIVDSRRVMAQANAAQGLRQQAEKQRNALKAEAQKIEAEFKAAEQELQKQRGALSPEAMQQKVREFQQKLGEAQNRFQQRTRNVDRAEAEAAGKIVQAMESSVREIAQERSYPMVLDRAAVIVFAGQLEITQEVINRVNRRLPTVAMQVATN